ncbi:hypothetical protein GGU11DRAFT_762981 [Lentinula aff. detonsa]|nr:hypothetical protein GGU11DRAFT_762981 [Lentinula aff. detonsa]
MIISSSVIRSSSLSIREAVRFNALPSLFAGVLPLFFLALLLRIERVCDSTVLVFSLLFPDFDFSVPSFSVFSLSFCFFDFSLSFFSFCSLSHSASTIPAANAARFLPMILAARRRCSIRASEVEEVAGLGKEDASGGSIVESKGICSKCSAASEVKGLPTIAAETSGDAGRGEGGLVAGGGMWVGQSKSVPGGSVRLDICFSEGTNLNGGTFGL